MRDKIEEFLQSKISGYGYNEDYFADIIYENLEEFKKIINKGENNERYSTIYRSCKNSGSR